MNNPIRFILAIISFSLGILLCASAAATAQIDTTIFRGMRPRSIGPAGMSGRISEVTAVESNPAIIFVGSATGGIWKSTSGGITWKPVFDREPVASIGAVAVNQRNPAIVWAGTGEGNPRNSAGVGGGVYKSLDGGETWNCTGLEKTERIPRILLHPNDERIAYAAALGPAWNDSPERGVYRTTDGGAHWQKILYVDEKTGCADLVMDPSNPDKLFAAMWQYRRWPWFFNSGGPGSGLYVTYDGGDHWTRCTEATGLPAGELGRIGIAIARSNPEVVYALVEAKKSALCRSDDGGRSWRVVNSERNIAERPFYYADIRVDPANENRIYSLRSSLTVSEDGGKSFRSIAFRIHPDHHSLWIHPGNPNLLIDGNDGGVAISYDRGRTWRFTDNLPLGQFYHISVDDAIPYNLYGGMQDNGSWRGPSDSWSWSGIQNFQWRSVGGGDGFGVLCDPDDPEIVYSMSQGGELSRTDLRTGESTRIRPDGPEGVPLRFNWNAAIAVDPFEHGTVYYGSQFLHKSTNRGNSWTIAGKDLTTNDSTKLKQKKSGGLTPDVTAAENHCTIVTIAPSPAKRGTIWVGTDDGNVQLTTDGGASWSNCAGGFPELPKGTWCPQIAPSPFDAEEAYAVFDDHRRGNWATYIYKTGDAGKSWKSLAKKRPWNLAPEEYWGYALAIEPDPVKRGLLFLGTEFGLFVSFDDGTTWMKWRHGFPTVSTMALKIHPRDNDLVIGTHGRSAYILDDIRPLRELTKEALDTAIRIFPIPPAYQHYLRSSAGYFGAGEGMFRGETKPYGAMVTFYLRSTADSAEAKKPGDASEASAETEAAPPEKKAKIRIEIYDASNTLIRRTETTADRGLNRWFWSLRRDGWDYPRAEKNPADSLKPDGPQVLPGMYRIVMRQGKRSAEQVVEVRQDPALSIAPEARKEKLDLAMRIGRRYECVSTILQRIGKVRRGLEIASGELKDSLSAPMKEMKKSIDSLRKNLDSLSAAVSGAPDRVGIQDDDDLVLAKLNAASGSVGGTLGAPTPSHLAFLRQADEALDLLLAEYNRIFSTRVARIKAALDAMKLGVVPAFGPLEKDW